MKNRWGFCWGSSTLHVRYGQRGVSAKKVVRAQAQAKRKAADREKACNGPTGTDAECAVWRMAFTDVDAKNDLWARGSKLNFCVWAI